MRRLKGLHKMTPEEVENLLMDELMDGAGTLTDICNEVGVPTRYAKMLLDNLVLKGLVITYEMKPSYEHAPNGTYYDMARTGGGKLDTAPLPADTPAQKR